MGKGGGGTSTVVQSGPAAEAQGRLLEALTPYLTGAYTNLAYGTLPAADRIAGLQRLSPAEENLPGYLRANYNPLIQGLSTGASDLYRGAQAPLPGENISGMRDVARMLVEGSQAELPRADLSSVLGERANLESQRLQASDLMHPLLPSLQYGPQAMAAPLPLKFGEGGESVGLMGLAQAAQAMNAPLDTNAILAPLQRSFRETVAPEIRGAAMRAGAPGGSVERELFNRAGDRFSEAAAGELSRAELARRGVGLQGLTAASGNIQQAINAEIARRQTGISALGTSSQALLGASGLGQGYLGQAIGSSQTLDQQELARRGLGVQALLGSAGIAEQANQQELARRTVGMQGIMSAGQLAGQAAQAGAVAPTTAANIGALNRDLGVRAAGTPYEMLLRALGGAPNPLAMATGSTTTQTPSMGSEIGGGIGSAFLLSGMLRNLGLFGGGAGGAGGAFAGLNPLAILGF